MKRMLKFEMHRIGISKKYFIIAVSVLVLILLFIAIIFIKNGFSPLAELEGDKAQRLGYYQSQIEFWESFINDSGLNKNHSQLENARFKIERLTFFINSGTTEFDYINLGEQFNGYEHYELFGFCFHFNEYSVFPFMIIALFSALWAFSFEKSKGTLKNLLQGSDRKTVFDSKLLVSAVLAIGLPFLLFIIGLTTMACCRRRMLLCYDNGYKAVNAITLFVQVGLRNLLVIAFIYAATLLCTTFFKPLVSGLIVPGGVTFIGFLAMIASNEQNMVFLNHSDFDAFGIFPVVGLLNYAGGFDLTFIIMAIMHTIAIAAFIISARFRFLNKDI